VRLPLRAPADLADPEPCGDDREITMRDEPSFAQDEPNTPDIDAKSRDPWRSNYDRTFFAFTALIGMSWIFTLLDRVPLLICGVVCYIVGALAYVLSLNPDRPASVCDGPPCVRGV
jgi:hypothetical protein